MSYAEIFVRCTYDEMYDIICVTNPVEKINIACMLYNKWRFDIEREDRFRYLCECPAVENNYYERLLAKNNIEIKDFIRDIKDWLNCVHPKKNVFTLIGPPNTGKTIIVGALQHLFVSKRLNNIDVTSDFVFGNLINCNLIVIEEPFFPPILLEDFKNLAGGQTMTVNSKYLPAQQLNRTPIIVSSNFPTYCRGHAARVSEEAIQARSYIYHINKPVDIDDYMIPEHFVYFVNKHGACC